MSDVTEQLYIIRMRTCTSDIKHDEFSIQSVFHVKTENCCHPLRKATE